MRRASRPWPIYQGRIQDALGVRRACARLSPSPHGCVRAGRPPGGGQWAEQACPAAVGRCPRTNTLRFPRSACEQFSRVGGHTFALFTAMSPPGTYLERLHGGRQLVPRRAQVACTIASMGQAGADVCGLTRTCAVVANCHHRATCGFRSGMPRGQSQPVASLRANPDSCGGANSAPPRDLDFYRTADAPLWPAPALENKPDNNGSAKLAGPYDLGRFLGPSTELLSPGVDVDVDHRATAPGWPPSDSGCGKRSTPHLRPTPRNKPDKYGPADWAGPYDLRKRSGANHAHISVPSVIQSGPAPPLARATPGSRLSPR